MARRGATKRTRGEYSDDDDEADSLDLADPTFKQKLSYVILDDVQKLVSDPAVGRVPGHALVKKSKHNDHGDSDSDDDDEYFGGVFHSNTQGRSRKRDNAALYTSMRWKYEEDAKRCYYHESPEALLMRNNEAEFREVNPTDISKYWGMTNTHIILNIVVNMLLQQIKGGRFRFVYKYGKISEQREQAMSNAWSNFVTDYVKCKCELGFVAVVWVHDPYLHGVPVVLNLTKYRVLVNTSGTNQHMWLYQRKPSPGMFDTNGLDRRGFMPDVMTFVDSGFVPDGAGRIRSKVTLSMQAFDECDTRVNMRRILEAKAVNKNIFITSKQASKDDFMANDELTSKRIERGVELINEMNSKLANLHNTLGPHATTFAPALSGRKSGIPGKAAISALIDETKQIASNVQSQRHNLRPDSMPVFEPDPYVPAGIEEAKAQAISLTAKVFGVPQAAVNPMATVQDWVSELRDQNTQEIQRALKTDMQEALEAIHHVIYDEVRIKKFVHDRIRGKRTRYGDANKADTSYNPHAPRDAVKDMIFSTAVTIILPSLPVKAFMKELYESGVMTLEGYGDYLHSNHSIEYKHLNKKPTPPQLVYIPPEPASSSSSSKPKAKKPKAKAKAKNPLKAAAKDRPNGTTKASAAVDNDDDQLEADELLVTSRRSMESLSSSSSLFEDETQFH